MILKKSDALFVVSGVVFVRESRIIYEKEGPIV